jgi:hypothetical protein
MEKRINVTTQSPFFRREQFAVEMRDGKDTLVMTLTEEESLNESLFFALFNKEFAPLPYTKNKNRKYLCMSDSFYIVAERGEKGFDTSFHYFAAEVKQKGDDITVNIAAVDDGTATDALYNCYLENEYTSADCHNERLVKLSGKHTSIMYIKAIESTEFIYLPYKGNQRKLDAYMNGAGKFSITNLYDYYEVETGRGICRYIKPDTLFYKRREDVYNNIEIVKLLKYVHDFSGKFWAVVEIAYTYPQDANVIKSELPEFYERECMSNAAYEKQKILKECKELPYVRDSYQIGDGIIHIPIETDAKEFTIPMSDFHFTLKNDENCGHLTRKEDGKLRISGLPTLCTLIEVERRFKLVYYKVNQFALCGDKHYAELHFCDQSDYFDSLSGEVFPCFTSSISHIVSVAYAGYLMYRGLIKPVQVDKDSLGKISAEEAAK